MKHDCPNQGIYEWKERVKKPKGCPRCKNRLDRETKKIKEGETQ